MMLNDKDESSFNSPLGVRGSNIFYGALPIHFELAKKLRDNQTDAENISLGEFTKIRH